MSGMYRLSKMECNFFPDTNFLDLPQELLAKILIGYCDTKNAYKLVCKTFLQIYYSHVTELCVSSFVFRNDHNLYLMPKLRQITVIFDNNDVTYVCNAFQDMNFVHLNCIILKQLDLKPCLNQVLDAFQKFEIEDFVCEHGVMSLDDVQQILKRFKFVKSCIVGINVWENVLPVVHLINTLAGKVNFSMQVVQQIPSKLLWYPLSCYRVMYPSGMLPESSNVPCTL